MKRAILTGVLLMAACKGGDAKDKPTGGSGQPRGSGEPPAKAVGAFDKLTVTVDGKPVPIATALIKKISPDRFQLYRSNQGGSCTELLDNVFNGGDDTKLDVLVDLTPRLTVDGKQATEVTYIHEGA